MPCRERSLVPGLVIYAWGVINALGVIYVFSVIYER
jgi:hypothetical protein